MGVERCLENVDTRRCLPTPTPPSPQGGGRRNENCGRPAVRPVRARPAEFLYRPFGAAAQSGAADARPRPICQRHCAAAHGSRRFCAFAARPCADQKIATAEAKKAPGVVAVVTGAELAKVITPWVGVLTHLKGIKSAPQYAIAVERACWQGEAVCAVVARSRAQAEDACAMVGCRIRSAAGRDRCGNRARCGDTGHSSRARRQPDV